MQRYVDWLEQYYLPNSPNSDIQPMIITAKSKDLNCIKTSIEYFKLKNKQILPIKYVEFEIIDNEIIFTEIL